MGEVTDSMINALNPAAIDLAVRDYDAQSIASTQEQSSVTTIVETSKKKDFSDTIKRDPNSYLSFKKDSEFLTWHAKFISLTKVHGVSL